MVDVHLWSGLRQLAGDAVVVTVKAATAREMLAALQTAHPGLAPVIRGGVSVVVDGEMVTDLTAPIHPGAEIYLMQRIKGG
ncbi:MoaD/ThiS family protein [Rhodobacter sp. Har01]|uniref:MoaD/ThiS family protein n=1 Tax=Rhodobacter sp. Har01 TaxID=2883999 RepID=UPI001D065FB9|nr:MoaD/ThiS family protein [Rhodobacter sp. Har01]MCB6178099.1 MoaD/ThiS family protein [Rhodobacter sp. Har01]